MHETGLEERHNIRIRIYVVRADGTRVDLPVAAHRGTMGRCGVLGCTCLGDPHDRV